MTALSGSEIHLRVGLSNVLFFSTVVLREVLFVVLGVGCERGLGVVGFGIRMPRMVLFSFCSGILGLGRMKQEVRFFRQRRQGVASSIAPASCSAQPGRAYEYSIQSRGFKVVCGVDEVGMGSLAGPVVASAVYLPEDFNVNVVGDSKKYTEKRRSVVYEELIVAPGLRYATCAVPASKIDEINIRQAALLAMSQVIDKLVVDFALVDGKYVPEKFTANAESIIKGDEKETCIAVASIIAKVTRDRIMMDLDQQYPHYHFASNKGYGSKKHIDALHTYGPSPEHRRSFSPLSNMLTT